ncbi:MAG: right-handed parallel beta-helix repeat-containing protein [Candidatus Micrarchaeota archaeon]|nr:right-handed parallel beta-helix repeat-containing protein [Candidatus Micrarchaeota archaeon]
MGIFLGLARFWSIVFLAVLAGFACANQYGVGPGQTYSTITDCLDAIDGTYGNTCSLNVASTVYTISGTNSYSITEEGGTVIRVGAGGVTLDCSGSDFTGNGTGYGFYSNGFDGATIKNCEFDDYHDGIWLDNSLSCNVSQNVVKNSQAFGIFLYFSNSSRVFNNTVNTTGSNGIHFDHSDSANVSNNYVENVLGTAAIFAHFSSSAVISGNNVRKSSYNGIWATTSLNTVISGNTVWTSGHNGIVLFEGANSSTVSGNTVDETNGDAGINIYQTSSCIFSGNVVLNSQNTGIILMPSSNSNNLSGNIISNQGTGISLSDSSDSNILSGNTVNGTAGESAVNLYNSAYNNLTGNNFSNNAYFALIIAVDSDGNRVEDNVFSHNGAEAHDYLVSNSPRSYDGTDYSDADDEPGMSMLGPAWSTDYVGIISDDRTASPSDAPFSYHNGTANLNLGLVTGSSGSHTALFDDSVATSCGDLEDYYNDVFEYPVACDYFEPNAFTANGYGNDYSSNFNASTATVSGFTSPPSLVYGFSTASGGVSIEASSNNTVTGNSFVFNAIGIALRSGCWNSVSGNSLASSNNIPLYVSKSACNFVLSNVSVSSVPDDYFVDASPTGFQASNANGVLNWGVGSVPLRNSLGQNLAIGGKLAALNASKLPDLNTTAQVTFYGVNCRSFTLYHSNGFYTLLADIMSNGVAVADQTSKGANCTDSSICRNVQCTGTTLTFQAMHFDSYGADSGAVPEFMGFAALAALLLAAAGFVAVRKRV